MTHQRTAPAPRPAAGGIPPVPAPREPRLMLGYFALAGCFLAIIVAGLIVHGHLTDIQTATARDNERWARRQADYAELGRLAARINSPAKEVFETRDPVVQQGHLDAALRPFGEALQAAGGEVDAELAHVDRRDSQLRIRLRRLRSHLKAIDDAALTMVDEAERIFSYFRSGQIEGAGAHMAMLDRRYAALADQVAGMGYTVREIQEIGFARNATLARQVSLFAYGIAATTLLFLCGVVVYGVTIDRRLRQAANERARALAEVRANEARKAAMLDSALDAVITIDVAGRISEFNPAASRTFGWPRETALGRDVVDLIVPPAQQAACRAGLAHYLATGESSLLNQRITVSALRADGGEFPAELSIAAFDDGGAPSFCAYLRDITAREQAEAELRAAKEAAEAATEAKSLFLANMSHEIRTPMNGVIGMTSLLLDTELTAEQHEFATTIRASADALLTIINDILDFSKIESGRLELDVHAFDLRECVEGAFDLVAPHAAAKGIDLAYSMDETVPEGLVGDVTRLRQVLVNLLSNAVKFTEQGEVVVTLSARPAGEAAVEVELAVADTGIGIPADRMDRLFQSFSQVDASTTRHYGGTGLGLAISKRLVELMGGRMTVTSTPGHGSCFRFSIVGQRAAGRHRDYLSALPPVLAGRPLLVVDDNPTNRRIVTLQTEAWGMRPYAAVSAAEALQWLDRGDRFDLAILDMHMPGMDGIQLAQAMRARGLTMPLVLLSSLGNRAGGEAGFAASLTKPVKPSQLFDAIVGVLEAQHVQRVVRANENVGFDRSLGARLPLRILLAEDNLINQKVAVRVLARFGYRVDLAGNGLEVLQALERQPYDVVLLDVQMPEMDGLTAAREICVRWPEQRPQLVAMTANAMEGDRQQCLAAGMDDYLSKPVQPAALSEALQRAAQARGLAATLPAAAGGAP